MPNPTKPAWKRLEEIMAQLRAPQGCPWDARQTPASLKPYLLEETHEVLEAIDRGDPAEICEELGDLLLQVVFQAQIFHERGKFTLEDVAAGIADKLERRHPHVFSDQTNRDPVFLDHQWDRIKAEEKRERPRPATLGGDIPRSLPALARTQKLWARLQRRSLAPEPQAVTASLENLVEQLRQLLRDPSHIEPKAAQLLSAILNSLCLWALQHELDLEQLLSQTTNSNLQALEELENTLTEDSRSLEELDETELQRLRRRLLPHF